MMTQYEIARAAWAIERQARTEGVEVAPENLIDLFERSTLEMARMNENTEAAIAECRGTITRLCQNPDSITKAELAASYRRSVRAVVHSTIIP